MSEPDPIVNSQSARLRVAVFLLVLGAMFVLAWMDELARRQDVIGARIEGALSMLQTVPEP